MPHLQRRETHVHAHMHTRTHSTHKSHMRTSKLLTSCDVETHARKINFFLWSQRGVHPTPHPTPTGPAPGLTLSRGPRVLPSVVKMDLSLKSGSVPTHEMMGLFQKEASSATGRSAADKTPPAE